MNPKKQYYTVAKLTFSISMAEDDLLWGYMDGYEPFIDNDASETTCFDLQIVSDIDCPETKFVWHDDSRPIDTTDMAVYLTDNEFVFKFRAPLSEQINAQMCCSRDFSKARIAINGSISERRSIFYMVTMLLFSLTCTSKSALLMHASAAVSEGKAYLFHAKSGTGKSTHNRLWQQYIPGSGVLNDDHPILRIDDDGVVIAYGSPWSGKTPCYRNEAYPLGAMVRINRAQQNAIKRLSVIESYASFSTSCTTMKWERSIMDNMHSTIERIITTIPCYRLDCLPDEGAARLCWSTVTGKEDK